MLRRRLFLIVVACAVSACSLQTLSCQSATSDPLVEGPVEFTGPVDPRAADPVTIAFLGDSLTAGFGLLSDEAFPVHLERMLQDDGFWEVETVNGGVSGDTTAGGRRRVSALIADPSVRILVVALGGNDALRGLTVGQTKDNLAAIIETAVGEGVEVLLVGMQAPTNLGGDYQRGFRALYEELSLEYSRSIAFVPFLLEGVAGDPGLNQPDGIHPTAQGQRVIAETLFPHLRGLVDAMLAGGVRP